MNELTATPTHRWNQSFQDVMIEISNHGAGREDDTLTQGYGTWCYYLLIHEKMFADVEDFNTHFWLEPSADSPDEKGRVWHNYSDGLLADLEWHSGITFYNKTGGLDGEARSIKAGCDYNHAWDEGHHGLYNERFLWGDACASVAKLRAMFPNMLWRCQYNGKWYPKDELIEVRTGVWYSQEGKEKSDAWDRKYAAKQASQ